MIFEKLTETGKLVSLGNCWKTIEKLSTWQSDTSFQSNLSKDRYEEDWNENGSLCGICRESRKAFAVTAVSRSEMPRCKSNFDPPSQHHFTLKVRMNSLC